MAASDAADKYPAPQLAEFSLTLTPSAGSTTEPTTLHIGCMRNPESFDTGVVGDSCIRRSSTVESDASSEYSAASSVSMALWAYIWSCNVFLCEITMTLPLSDATVHELGAGCALGAVSAAAAGAKAVTASDIIVTAAAAVQHSVLRNKNATPIEYTMFDWADETARLELAGSADLVLGSDVAYMASAVPPLAASTLALLAPGGAAIIIDPCRLGADGLGQALEDESQRCGNAAARCYTLHNTWSPNNAAVPELRVFVVYKYQPEAPEGAVKTTELQRAVQSSIEDYSKSRCCANMDDALTKAGLDSSSHTLDVQTLFVES